MTAGRATTTRRGSRPPFEQVVEEHGPTVMRVCRAILDPADAEDAWIDTFVSAMRAYPELRPGSNVRGWLVTIAHNAPSTCSGPRAGGRSRPIVCPTSPRPRPTPSTPPADTTRCAPHSTRCAPKQRTAVVYRHLGELPYPEIARAMGTSETAARRNVSDGIAKLRTRLREDRP